VKKWIFVITVLVFVGDYAVAGDLVPATSDDLNAFDSQLSSQSGNDNHFDGLNFGKTVSAEAHKLKAEGQQGKTKMGDWVRDQRSKSDQSGAPDADSDHGSSGSKADERTAHGNSSSSGHSRGNGQN
jgi:hypothetical protein